MVERGVDEDAGCGGRGEEGAVGVGDGLGEVATGDDDNGLGVGCAGGFTVDECHCDRVASAPMLKRNLEREMQVQEAADLVAMMLVYVRGSAMAQLAT